MKTKILLLFILLTSFVYEASAFRIVINGGGNGRDPKFKKIVVEQDLIKCLGNGNNICPVNFSEAQGISTGNWYKLNEVVSYVAEQVANGNKSGNTNYKNDLPVSWKMDVEGNMEIDIKEQAIKGLEKYDLD